MELIYMLVGMAIFYCGYHTGRKAKHTEQPFFPPLLQVGKVFKRKEKDGIKDVETEKLNKFYS